MPIRFVLLVKKHSPGAPPDVRFEAVPEDMPTWTHPLEPTGPKIRPGTGPDPLFFPLWSTTTEHCATTLTLHPAVRFRTVPGEFPDPEAALLISRGTPIAAAPVKIAALRMKALRGPASEEDSTTAFPGGAGFVPERAEAIEDSGQTIPSFLRSSFSSGAAAVGS